MCTVQSPRHRHCAICVTWWSGAYRRGYMGYIYPPKISPSKLLWDKNDVKTVIEHEYYSFIPPPKFYTSPKRISGYTPAGGVILSTTTLPGAL